MRVLKGWITTTVLMATLMVSTASANGGIIIAGLNQPTPAPCTETRDDKSDIGIIIAGVGIIIAGFTGIIIAGGAEETPDCGIIFGG